jgi:hypothetical protein
LGTIDWVIVIAQMMRIASVLFFSAHLSDLQQITLGVAGQALTRERGRTVKTGSHDMMSVAGKGIDN